jgi:DNA-directed RNA polymerase omega subunit
MPNVHEAIAEMAEQSEQAPLDSKYRLIIVAAKRSKQLQRGARPRVEIDPQKHKSTRIALEEVLHGKVAYTILDDDRDKE